MCNIPSDRSYGWVIQGPITYSVGCTSKQSDALYHIMVSHGSPGASSQRKTLKENARMPPTWNIPFVCGINIYICCRVPCRWPPPQVWVPR